MVQIEEGTTALLLTIIIRNNTHWLGKVPGPVPIVGDGNISEMIKDEESNNMSHYEHLPVHVHVHADLLRKDIAFEHDNENEHRNDDDAHGSEQRCDWDYVWSEIR